MLNYIIFVSMPAKEFAGQQFLPLNVSVSSHPEIFVSQKFAESFAFLAPLRSRGLHWKVLTFYISTVVGCQAPD